MMGKRTLTSSAGSSIRRFEDEDKNLEAFLNEIDSDEDSPKKVRSAAARTSTSNYVQNTTESVRSFRGLGIPSSTPPNNNLFNSIKSVGSDYNQFTSKELLSKSGTSDAFSSADYKQMLNSGYQNSSGNYNTLKSTAKSAVTVSTIPAADDIDSSSEGRVFENLDDLGYGDEELVLSDDQSSTLKSTLKSSDSFPVYSTSKTDSLNILTNKQPNNTNHHISLSQPTKPNNDQSNSSVKPNSPKKTFSQSPKETKTSTCQTSSDIMKDIAEKDGMINILKKELQLKEQQILQLRTEMEIERRQKYNVADESIQAIVDQYDKFIQVRIEENNDKEVIEGFQKIKARNQELEMELMDKQEEIEQLHSRIKTMKTELVSTQNESNPQIFQKQISKLTKQVTELQEENLALRDEIQKQMDVINFNSQLEIDDKELNQTSKSVEDENEQLRRQIANNEKFLIEYQRQNEKLGKENRELHNEIKKLRNDLGTINRKKALGEHTTSDTQSKLHSKIKELQEQLHHERDTHSRREADLLDQIERVKKSKEELEKNLQMLDPKKLENQHIFMKSVEEKIQNAEKVYNEKMKELCTRLQAQKEMEEHYEQQEETIKHQDRQLYNLKNRIRDLETTLFDIESRLKEKERESRDLKNENADLWKEKKDFHKLKERISFLETELSSKDENINSLTQELEKTKLENEKKMNELSIKSKKVEALKDREMETRLKELKDFYIKKQNELNNTIKELSRGKKIPPPKSPGKAQHDPAVVSHDVKNDDKKNDGINVEFLKDELNAKQLVIEELNAKISELEKLHQQQQNQNTSVISDGKGFEAKVAEESELLFEIRKLQKEKEELERKLEVSEMNKEYIKENAKEQVKTAFAEMNELREKHKLVIKDLEERHVQEMNYQERLFKEEIESYKHIIENTTKVNSKQEQIVEDSSENSRILMLRQLASRLENIESKHKIKEMELERELNETKYRYEVKITSLKQQLELTIQQKNQQVLQLKTSLDNLVSTLHKLKLAQNDHHVFSMV
ncbi:hypothetical protein C9374_004958 [Naegleria lovaniensis]|uniref:Centrosomal protein of 162 kDa n=1 Tax=Naegleria lovaniensis TaxID=51637 RepID=A0AA88GPN8_NAELO|nr:uncharacterized protein C9374_004958 [Naegleria lovaniensis]KAG2382991.1 hypothetical protein C9374_004958 [Naegleria lovaniensis]